MLKLRSAHHHAWIKWFLAAGVVIGLTAGLDTAYAGREKKSDPGGALSTDFQKEALNSVPSFGQALNGTWIVTTEPEHPANQVLAQNDYSRQLALFLTKSKMVNFECSVRIRTDTFEHKSRNWQIGFFFRNQDPRHYYKLRMSAANVALVAVTPPRPQGVLASEGRTTAARADVQKNGENLLFFFPLGVSKDSWHTLGIRCWGENITVLLDGRELQTVNDPGIGSGQIGLFTYNTRAYFDDLSIRPHPVPKLTKGLGSDLATLSLSQVQEITVYYYLPADAPVLLRILDPGGKVFNVLTKGVHSAGLNSVIWDGQGLTRLRPEPGIYTVELNALNKNRTCTIRVKNDSGGKGSK